MSIRKKTEEDFRVAIKNKLSERGSVHGRVWLDLSQYENKFTIDTTPIDPVKSCKIIYPIHSYEIFEMDEDQVAILQDLMCQKIEKYFIEKISEASCNSKIIYAEGDILISLEYRIAIIDIFYNLIFLQAPGC